MSFPRSSGILLHPTSLPGPFGIGDFGDAADAFLDFLAAGGQSLWQVLPLGPTGYGDSPYQSFSAFAGNTLLISPERLEREGLLSASDLSGAPSFPADRINFGDVINFKNRLLNRAFENYRRGAAIHLRADFEAFSQRAAHWLDDYALYRALKDSQHGRAWNEWDSALVRREAAALAAAREQLREPIEAQKFYQFLFFKQWDALKARCHELSIRVIGDIPIFVARDSADVWTHQDEFKLDEEGNPLVVAGVPPDYFSSTGQLWGNPIYDWERMRADGFQWWLGRVRSTLDIFDIIRIDHFRGFAATWEVPGRDKTAEHGSWVSVPGRELFAAIKNSFKDVPVIAEDLGVITPDVESLRDDFGFPGMRILQYGFGGDSQSRDLPHNYPRNTVVYTGTHDNDTVVGWFKSEAGAGSTREAAQIERERRFCLDYLNARSEEIHWDFIRAALASVGDVAIFPLQDVLGLGAEGRMNLPSSTGGNWNWRYRADALREELSVRLREMTALYGRAR